MTARFAGKSVVVTGGASGIGEAMVRLAAAEGARVAIADLDEARGNKLVEDLGSDNALFIRCDVADANQAARFVDSTAAQFGGGNLLSTTPGSPAWVQLPALVPRSGGRVCT